MANDGFVIGAGRHKSLAVNRASFRVAVSVRFQIGVQKDLGGNFVQNFLFGLPRQSQVSQVFLGLRTGKPFIEIDDWQLSQFL